MKPDNILLVKREHPMGRLKRDPPPKKAKYKNFSNCEGSLKLDSYRRICCCYDTTKKQ